MYFRNDINVLEIGATGKTSVFNRIIDNPSIKWNTLDIGKNWIGDIENEPLHITSEFEYKYPFENETFDIVVSCNVMEHVAELWTWFAELKRITKNKGLIIVISPVSWDYHATPIDCWRVYPEGMKALMKHNDLKILINIFESLEKMYIPLSTPTIPGNSSFKMDRSFRKKFKAIIKYNKIMHFIPFFKHFKIPLSVCFDTICISEK